LKKNKKRFLTSYSVFDIIIIAMCAGLGIALKPILVPLSHIITGPLFIPGGAFAGGFYMLFIVVAAGLTEKKWAATLTCIVQALLVLITGVIGSHGILSLATYTLPGVMVDMLLLLIRHNGCGPVCCLFSGITANLTGSFMSNVVFFRLPLVPLMLVLFSAAFSGGIGGLIAWGIVSRLRLFITVFEKRKDVREVEANEK
jgi:hypothetical protein